jgi:hypothetical protein
MLERFWLGASECARRTTCSTSTSSLSKVEDWGGSKAQGIQLQQQQQQLLQAMLWPLLCAPALLLLPPPLRWLSPRQRLVRVSGQGVLQ